MSQIHNYYDLHAYKRGQSMFKISRQPTVKSGAVDWPVAGLLFNFGPFGQKITVHTT